MAQYLVQVQDKTNIEFLEQFGTIMHISKFSTIVIFNGNVGVDKELMNHPNVISVSVANKYRLAPTQ